MANWEDYAVYEDLDPDPNYGFKKGKLKYPKGDGGDDVNQTVLVVYGGVSYIDLQTQGSDQYLCYGTLVEEDKGTSTLATVAAAIAAAAGAAGTAAATAVAAVVNGRSTVGSIEVVCVKVADIEPVTSDTLGVTGHYFASLSDDFEINGDTGLIRSDKFGLKWNNLESSVEWDDDTKGRYNSIEDGSVSGSITIVKENSYDLSTTAAFNIFYDLNTGANQTSPTITLVGGSGGEQFDVAYGAVEEDGIKGKFKRYDSTWADYVDTRIDELVKEAIQGAYQARAGLNFKKTIERGFKNRNVTIFPGETMEGSTEETTGEQTMGTDVTAGTSDTTTTTTTMTTSNGGSTQGGYQ